MQTTQEARGAGVPKMIDARAHAVLDYTAAATFIAMGWSLMARNRRAANLAFASGMSVLGLSLFTDYPGGVFRKISFKTHGTVDMLQAGLVALGPTLMGFADTPEAQLFHGSAAVESAIVAATDWQTAA